VSKEVRIVSEFREGLRKVEPELGFGAYRSIYALRANRPMSNGYVSIFYTVWVDYADEAWVMIAEGSNPEGEPFKAFAMSPEEKDSMETRDCPAVKALIEEQGISVKSLAIALMQSTE